MIFKSTIQKCVFFLIRIVNAATAAADDLRYAPTVGNAETVAADDRQITATAKMRQLQHPSDDIR